jgi:hypothetical protein
MRAAPRQPCALRQLSAAASQSGTKAQLCAFSPMTRALFPLPVILPVILASAISGLVSTIGLLALINYFAGQLVAEVSGICLGGLLILTVIL